MSETAWKIARLSSRHERRSFDCGQATLNEWLALLATQYDKRDLARTYVATRPSDVAVLDYYAISNHRVTVNALPEGQAKGLPRIDIPVALLGRLAVDRAAQAQGLGQFLLIDALRRVQQIADQIGIRAVEVYAIDERARTFYEKFGFVRLVDDPNHLFLSIQVIRKLKLPSPD